MDKKFEMPEVQVITLNADVIVTSGGDEDCAYEA